jgi:hypothetical protein
MQRPTWVTIVGILAIIFGVFGVMSGAQEIIMPHMLDMQKEVLLEVNEMLQKSQSKDSQSGGTADANAEQGFNPFKLMNYFSHQLELPDWFRTFAPLFGTISILVSISYLLSGVFFLMLKSFAPMMFNITLGISIVWSVISAVIYGVSDNIILIMNVPGSITSVIIDIVLITIILLSSQQAFRN